MNVNDRFWLDVIASRPCEREAGGTEPSCAEYGIPPEKRCSACLARFVTAPKPSLDLSVVLRAEAKDWSPEGPGGLMRAMLESVADRLEGKK